MTSTRISDDLPSSGNPHQLIASTDWQHLEVFFGPDEGCPTVPDLLTTLIQGTAAARARALIGLGEAVHHQDSIVEATAPAMLVVAALLTDPGTDRVPLPAVPHRTDTPPSLRAGLLRLMASVASGVDQYVEAASRHFGFELSPAIRQVRAIRPALFPAVHDLLDDPDLDVRQAAALAVIPLLEDPALAAHRPAIWERAHTILSASTNRHHRALTARIRSLLEEATIPNGGMNNDPPS